MDLTATEKLNFGLDATESLDLSESEESIFVEDSVVKSPVKPVTPAKPRPVKRIKDEGEKKNTVFKVIVVILLLLLLILLGALVIKHKADSEYAKGGVVLDDRSNSDPTQQTVNEELANRQVYFSGIDDATISKQTVVYLENLPENGDFLMQYEITDTDTGKVIEKTGLIPSGEHVDWIPGETLEAGEYHLNFREIPYYQIGEDDYMTLTTGNNQVTFVIQ